MQQCPMCSTVYNDHVESCPMCSNDDYSDHFKSEGLIEISTKELMLNDHSFQRCDKCNALIRMNTRVTAAKNLCPICDAPTYKVRTAELDK